MRRQSIDCTVSQSADKFGSLRRQMHRLFHKFNIAVHRQLFKAQIFKVQYLDLKHGAQMVRKKLAASSLKLFARIESLSAPDVRR